MTDILDRIINRKTDNSFESMFLNFIAIISIFFGINLVILSISVKSNIISILLIIFIISISVYIYIKPKNRSNYKKNVYTLIIIWTIIIYPLMWVITGGSRGIMPIFLVFHVAMSTILLSGLKQKMIIFLNILVIFILFMMEYKFQNVIIGQQTRVMRLWSIGLISTQLIFVIFFITTYIMKKYNTNINFLKEAHKELIEVHNELNKASITDEMTGIYNRSYVIDKLTREIMSNGEIKTSVIMFDIDYFKLINDNFGHSIGDEVLIKVSQLFKGNLRATDFLGRIGGEEFLIVLADTDMENAFNIAEKLRIMVSKMKWNYKDLKLTISGGVYCTDKNETINEVLKGVDICLYEAKNNGRNRIIGN